MITLITGAPGAGKTAALVDIIANGPTDRAVYVSGIPDLKIEGREVVELEDPRRWPETVPDGSIIVIDEVQRVWRPRAPGTKVPPDIAALETHRHHGIDFYVITQSPSLMDKNVRDLVGRHVHLREMGVLGRWWYEWPECAQNCQSGWKTAPIKKRYRLPKRVFGLYTSASLHIKPVRSFPVILLVVAGAVIAAVVLGWQGYRSVAAKMGPQDMTPKAVAARSDPLGTGAGINRQAQGVPATQPAQVQPAFIDDRVAFIPRLSAKPETAPAYDMVRQVVAMPIIVGGACSKTKCRCVNQQGTDAGITDEACRRWIDSPPFNPYRPDTPEVAPSAAQALPAKVEEQPSEADTTLMSFTVDGGKKVTAR